MIPYGKQNITQEDIDSVIKVLKSDFLTQGPQVPAFEKSLIDYTGANCAIALNSATSALHVACLSLGLGPGDILWTSPITFVASANCAIYCGAEVDFIDIDPLTYNISLSKLEDKLYSSSKSNTLPKIVMPVHLCGQSCDMEAIYNLSQKFGFKIIEDASHAIGGKYKNEPIGSCRFSDISVFSFHPVKIITTAEGGVALTNDSLLKEKMSLYRSHGVTRNQEMMVNQSHGGWYYEQIALGYNYRMNDLQAALGISQLKRLDQIVAERHQLARRYNRLLADLPIILPKQSKDSYSSFHLYIVKLQLNKISKSQKEIFKSLRENGVGVNLHYIPVHTQPYYSNLGFKEGDFPNSENYYQAALTLPLFYGMTFEQQDTVINVLSRIIRE